MLQGQLYVFYIVIIIIIIITLNKVFICIMTSWATAQVTDSRSLLCGSVTLKPAELLYRVFHASVTTKRSLDMLLLRLSLCASERHIWRRMPLVAMAAESNGHVRLTRAVSVSRCTWHVTDAA
jgi:hypothetical protein